MPQIGRERGIREVLEPAGPIHYRYDAITSRVAPIRLAATEFRRLTAGWMPIIGRGIEGAMADSLTAERSWQDCIHVVGSGPEHNRSTDRNPNNAYPDRLVNSIL